jgi:hypothetical protein
MATTFEGSPTPRFGPPRIRFSTPLRVPSATADLFAVAPDGRFLLSLPRDPSGLSPLRVVTGWRPSAGR